MTMLEFDRFLKADAACHFHGSGIWNAAMLSQLTSLRDCEWSWICNEAANSTLKYLENSGRRKSCSFIYFFVFHDVQNRGVCFCTCCATGRGKAFFLL